MKSALFAVLALILVSSPIDVADSSHAQEDEPVLRQSVASARDLYRKAVKEFDSGEEGALITLRNACRRYEEAVDGDPTDVELFIERCRAQRLRAEKTDPNDGRVADRALEWLMRQQTRAGLWTFRYEHPEGNAAEESVDRSTIRSTSIALLAMFGAGKSHRDGRWQNEIEAGLTYVMSEARVDAKGIDFRGACGDVVSHALATMLLCEAYEMTSDPRLEVPSQKGVTFLESLQFPETGGWGVVGDEGSQVFATAWCVMALQSAKRARLHVDPQTSRLVEKFLAARQTEGGAFFGTVKPGKEPKATAAGLLCRCLLGCDSKDAALIKGAEYLAEPGTIGDDLETRFFAQQVFIHVGGDIWRKCNRASRDLIIAAQDRDEKHLGSWVFEKDATATTRGRLWHTALSTLTLEVYYRYLTVFNSADSRGLVELKTDDTDEAD